MSHLVRAIEPVDARSALEVHHAAVHVTAARDYALSILEEWARLPITDEAVEQFNTNPEREVRLVADWAGKVVGFAAVVPPNSELRACYVSPEAAGRGIGRALVFKLEHIAMNEGVTSLWLHSSLTAHPFYEALGYETEGHGEHVLRSGQRMACVYMRKTLMPSI